MMKSDEFDLLRAIRADSAGSVSLSPARRQLLLRRFERNGWTRNGRLTQKGERLAGTQPEPAASPEPEGQEERQSEDGDIQGPSREELGDPT